MNKKEEFKSFAALHPQLLNYLKANKSKTWQDLYEIYDIYGPNNSVWESYFKTEVKDSTKQATKNTIDGIKDLVKNIDSSTIQEHIKTAQKALGFIEELTKKGASNISNIPKGPTSPRPISKFFGD